MIEQTIFPLIMYQIMIANDNLVLWQFIFACETNGFHLVHNQRKLSVRSYINFFSIWKYILVLLYTHHATSETFCAPRNSFIYCHPHKRTHFLRYFGKDSNCYCCRNTEGIVSIYEDIKTSFYKSFSMKNIRKYNIRSHCRWILLNNNGFYGIHYSNGISLFHNGIDNKE